MCKVAFYLYSCFFFFLLQALYKKRKNRSHPAAKSMADLEVSTEAAESPEAFFHNLDMASLENFCHLAEGGS